MKKLLILLVGLLFWLLALTGCKSPLSDMVEIENVFIVNAAAIDSGFKGEKVKLTVISKVLNVEGKEPSRTGGTTSEILSAQGRTVFEAARNLNLYSNRRIFWGHLRYIILNKNAAQKDVMDFLDFFVRGRESRLYARLLVVKGSRAENVLSANISSRESLVDILDGLFRESERLSISRAVTLRESIAKFDSRLTDVCIPSVQLAQNYSQEDSLSKEVIKLDGFAVFKGPRLVDFITGGTARGVNWITGEVKSCPLTVTDSAGKEVSIDIINATSRISAEFKNDLPEVTVIIETSGNLHEQQSNENLFNDTDMSNLGKKLAAKVKDEAEGAVSFAQANGVDILDLGDALYHRYPLQWEKIERNWKTIFPVINIKVAVKARINRSYIIQKPIASVGDSKP